MTGLFAESLQYLHITPFQNYFMIAVGHVSVILAKRSYFSMKLKMELTEILEVTGSSFQVIVI
jgi:hypothetical protein